MDGLEVSASYTPSNGTTEVESSEDYGFKYTGVEGLTIGAATGDDNTSATAGVETTNMLVVSTPAVADVLSSPVAAPIVKPSTPVYLKPQSSELSTSVVPFDGVYEAETSNPSIKDEFE